MVHGKSSFLIPRFIICQNLLLNVEENSKTYHGNFNINIMAGSYLNTVEGSEKGLLSRERGVEDQGWRLYHA